MLSRKTTLIPVKSGEFSLWAGVDVVPATLISDYDVDKCWATQNYVIVVLVQANV